MDLNNISFFLILIFLSYFFNKYLPIILNGFNSNLLKDNQFIKPQAFHEIPVSITGGLGIFFSFLIVYLYLFFFGEFIYYEYLTFCTLFFFLGLLDDLEITIRPKLRLILMIVFPEHIGQPLYFFEDKLLTLLLNSCPLSQRI